MRKTMRTILLVVLLAGSAFSIVLLGSSNFSLAHNNHQQSSVQHDEEVARSMKKIKRAYQSALRSDSLEQMKPAIAQLVALSRHAATLQYGINPTERTDYQKGMQRLHLDLQRLNAAVAANDLPLARKILTTQIKATRSHSHEKLGVAED